MDGTNLAFSFWLSVLIIGLISWPFTRLLFGSLSDKGYAISKALGLIILSYVMFLLATFRIFPLVLSSLILLIIVWTIFNIFLAVKYRLLKDINFKTVFLDELLFSSIYILWVHLKSIHPEIYQIERFMDFGFIQTLLNSRYLPLEDVWMSGLPLNYYYFGHFLAFYLIKLSQVPTVAGFYLAGAYLFAVLGVCIYRLAFDLCTSLNTSVKRVTAALAGLVSLFFVLFAGDLGSAVKFLSGKSFFYPEPTRVIPGTITEMPLYSFLVADLHAHVWGLLNGLIVLTYLFVIWKDKRTKLKSILPLAFFIGIAALTNTWDAISLSLLSSVILFFVLKTERVSLKKTLLDLALYMSIIVVFMLVFATPWLLFFKSPVSHISFVRQHSPFKEWFSFWGLFVIATGFFLTLQFRKIKTDWTKHSFLISTAASAFILLGLTELFYVNDILVDGEWFRANTVFKVTSQVWLWLGLVTGPLTLQLIISSRKIVFKIITSAVLVILILAGAAYPIKAINQALLVGTKYSGLTSGLNWWQERYPDDYQAYLFLRNLRDNLPEGDRKHIILEAEGESYSDTSRFSTFLGWPTVAGWSVHEWTWRGSFEQIGSRGLDVREIYLGEDPATALDLLKKYRVNYIVIGQIEKERYGDYLKTDKIAEIARPVFVSGGTTVYTTNQDL